jgi:hypothetical protein
MHRGILALALAAFLTLPAQAEYTFRPFNSGGGGSGIGTVNGIVKGDGAGNPSAAVAGTDYVSPALTSGRIYVGSAGNLATGVPMGGDCTIVAAGTITCTKINGATIGTMALQNANAVAITGGTGAFTGTISSNASSPTLSLKTTQAGTREWRWAGAFNDPDSISLVDVTASNAQRLYINSSGNVGVGTISPSYRLDIADNRDAVTPARIFNSSAGTGAQAILTADNGTNKAYFGVRGTGSAAGTGRGLVYPAVHEHLRAHRRGLHRGGGDRDLDRHRLGQVDRAADGLHAQITGNDTIPAGVFFAIPCGARVQVDGAAVLTFNAETDDNTCQKFSASGAGAGAGGGIVKGLRLNRPEWWGAAGDCNYGGACTHDDSGPLQQAFNSAQNSGSNSSGGQRASQVRLRQGLRRQHRDCRDRLTHRAAADQRLRAARRRQQRRPDRHSTAAPASPALFLPSPASQHQHRNPRL